MSACFLVVFHVFGDGTMPASFKLIESKISTTGVIAATYVRDGEIKTGSF